MELRVTDGIVHTERVETWRRPPRRHAGGRVCEAPGCRTILSVYNGSTRCGLHGLVGENDGHRVHRSASVTAPAA